MGKEELNKKLYGIHYKLLLINESMKIFHDCDNITYERAQSLIEILQGKYNDGGMLNGNQTV